MTSSQEAAMLPLPHPIGIFKAFVINHPVQLVATKRASTHSNHDIIIDIVGLAGPGDPQRSLLKCSAKFGPFGGSKVFRVSETGQRLSTMRKTGSFMSRGWLLEGPDGEHLVESGTKEAYGQVHFTSTVGDERERPTELECRGGRIFWNETRVAQIRPIKNTRWENSDANIPLTTKQAYGINVAPGIDLSIIAAILVSLYD
jgi:hypothetical protein